MAAKNICKFEKYGFCKLKKQCKEYHPIEICKKQICNIGKCDKRHPQPCRYFRSGNCRFKKACKYEHREHINTNELFEIIENLKKDKMVQAEKINGLEKDKNVQAEKISLLHSRLSYLEKEYVFFLKKHTNENEEEIPNNQDTIVSDDQEQKINKAALVNIDHEDAPEVKEESESYSKECFKEEIKFCVGIETMINEFENDIKNETCETNEKAKQMLTKFRVDLYNYFDYEVGDDLITEGSNDIFLGRKGIELQKLMHKFDRGCKSIVISNFTNTDYKSLIMEKLRSFITEVIKIRNLKLTN